MGCNMKKSIYLLDTNIISELAKPSPNKKVVKLIDEKKSLCAISVTTWNELIYGLLNYPEGKKKSYLFDFITDYIQSTFPIISLDNHSAWILGDLRSKLKTVGRNADEITGYADIELAAMAISNQMILVTRNVKHFEAVKTIDSAFYYENWFE